MFKLYNPIDHTTVDATRGHCPLSLSLTSLVKTIFHDGNSVGDSLVPPKTRRPADLR